MEGMEPKWKCTACRNNPQIKTGNLKAIISYIHHTPRRLVGATHWGCQPGRALGQSASDKGARRPRLLR